MKILISLTLLYATFHNAYCFENFTTIAEDYVRCVEEANDLKATWWSLTAKHPFFDENERFKTYKIRVYENRTFSTAPQVVLQRDVTQIFPDQVDVNDGPTPTTITYRESNRLSESQSSSVENNLAFGADIEVSGQVSFFTAGVSGGASTESSDSSTTSNTKSKESLSLRQYTVNPYSEVVASTLLVRRKLEKSITHEIVIDGYLAIAFSDYVKPGEASNYKTIKDITDPSFWKDCGSGLPPTASRKGVYLLPIAVLANDDNLKSKDDMSLYYQVTEVQKIEDEKVRFKLNGKSLTGNKKKAFDELCS